MSETITMETLCGTPEAVTSATVTDITFDSMIFRWGEPQNYNGDASNRQYQVSLLREITLLINVLLKTL